MKTVFIEVRSSKDVKPILEKNISLLANYQKIGLIATVQFLEQLEQTKSFLESKGKQIFIGKGKHTVYPGQVLGCDPCAALEIKDNVDALLYIGTGEFHPLAVGPNKPLFVLNPSSETLSEFPQSELRRHQNKIAARVSKVKDAQVIGILVSTKPGQSNIKQAEEAKKTLEKQGKQVHLFIGDTFSPEDLNNFSEIKAWVNTACPRIVDTESLRMPICNTSELLK